MNEQTLDEDMDDDDGYVEFEDMVDGFVSHRLQVMEVVGNQYPTRDGFIAQVMLLIEIALLGIPPNEEAMREAQEMTDKFAEDKISILEAPSAKWAKKVIRLAVQYIKHRRDIAEHEHHAHCLNCNPPEGRNN
jgi:hypothetical protein